MSNISEFKPKIDSDDLTPEAIMLDSQTYITNAKAKGLKVHGVIVVILLDNPDDEIKIKKDVAVSYSSGLDPYERKGMIAEAADIVSKKV